MCWGNNVHGQTGNGAGSLVPAPVVIGNDLEVDRVVANYADACARATDGSWWCWGRNTWGMVGDGTTTQRTTPVAVSH